MIRESIGKKTKKWYNAWMPLHTQKYGLGTLKKHILAVQKKVPSTGVNVSHFGSVALALVLMMGGYTWNSLQTAHGLTIVTNTSPLILTGNTVMTISNVDYIQRNNIILEDNAQLIVESGAILEHRHDYSFQYTLDAYDNSKVIVRNAEIQSSTWLNWNFHDASTYILRNTTVTSSNIWHSLSDTASGSAVGTPFRGTLGGSGSLDIQNSSGSFVEFLYPANSTADNTLLTNQDIADVSIPGVGDTNIDFHFRIRNASASDWGLTIGANSDIIIRDTDGLTSTILVATPWTGETVELNELGPDYYADETFTIVDSTLRLINVTANPWSPIAGGTNNTLILRNSTLADNAFSSGNANVQIINSTGSFVRAGAYVTMTVSGSVIRGDAIASQSGTLTIRNSIIQGDVIAEDDGTINIIDSTVLGTISEQGSNHITQTCTSPSCHLSKFWIGPNGGSFKNNAYWSLTSGGDNDTTAPSSSDNVIFDDGANTNAVMTGSISVNSLRMISSYTQQVNASGATITLADDFELEDGTFIAPSDFVVNGDFLHNGGTFTANGGLVRSTSSGATHVFSGSTTFYNLSFTASGQLSIHPATVLTVSNTLHLGDNASASERLLLRSSTSGTQWKIDARGSRTLKYLDIKDSNNINATSMNCATGCIDSGGNANWTIPGSGTTKYWIGSAGGSFTSDTNWSTTSGGSNNTTAPGTNDTAVFDGGSDTNCTLSSTVDVYGMEVRSGYTQTISQSSTTTLTLSGGGLTMSSGRFSAGSAVTINGPFNLYSTSASTYFFANSATITVAGNWTVQGSNSYNLFPFNYGTSTVVLSGNSTTNTFSTLVAFNNLTVNANTGAIKTFTGGSVVTLNNKLNSTLRLVNGTINGPSSFVIYNGGNLSVEPRFDGGTATVRLTGADVRSVHLSGGSILPALTLASTGVTIMGPSSGTTTFEEAFSMQAGTFTGGAGTVNFGGSFSQSSGTFNAAETTIFSSSFFISGTSTFNAGSTSLSMRGAMTLSSPGTFSAGTSTVTLDGTSQTLSGSITFYNLAKTSRDGSTLSFYAGTTQTVTGTLTLSGSTASPLLLRSTTTGTQWKINAQGSRVLRGLNVKDARNMHATAMSCTVSCTDSGNTNMWAFASTTTLTSSLNPAGYGSNVVLTATMSPSSATGTITFKDGSTTLGTASIGNGSGKLTVSNLSIGSHALTATYGGSPTLSGSTSNSVSQTITIGQPTIALTSSSNPSVLSGSVQFTVTLSPSDATGSVTLKEGSTTLGTASLSHGSGSITTSSLSLGSHSLVAIYGGNSFYLTATSSTLTQTVSSNVTFTTATLISGSNPSTFGNSILLTVSMTPSTASGSAAIMRGATTLGTATVSHGSGTILVSSLGVGTHSITAVFSGGGYAGSTSNTVSQTVAKAATTTYLSSSLNPATFDETVPFVITVVPSSATGAVLLKQNGTTVGSALLSHGSGTIHTSSLITGSHGMTAHYQGNGEYETSNSATLTQTIQPVETTLTVVSSPNPSTVGDTVTITIAISPDEATGSVSVYDGITFLGTLILTHGSASTTYSAFSAGLHTITASYGGQDPYDGSLGHVTHSVLASTGEESSPRVSVGGGGGGGGGTSPKSSDASLKEELHKAAPVTLSINRVFHDVPDSAWFAPYISSLYTAKIISGYSDPQGNSRHLFGPANSVTYAEAAKMALRIGGKKIPSTTPKTRSAKNTWATGYIAAMEQMHVSTFKNPSLDVHAPVSRAVFLQILMETWNIQLKSTKVPYLDVSASSATIRAIAQATTDGLVSGDSNKKTFRPNDPVNRAEVSKILLKAMQKYFP